MKQKLTLLITLLISLQGLAQQPEGTWQGLLKVQGMELLLVFNITETEEGLQATMDSPDQGAFDIAVDEVSFADGELKLVINAASIQYKGKFENDSIKGTFSQAGMEVPLDLSREKPLRTTLVRPQEPQPPFPYHTEDVVFHNSAADIKLAGTLSLPRRQGFFPAVIMITGSGPQNRDEEIMGHKPFLVIADYLTRNGIAVLRFDDRGVAQSEGDFSTATSYDFATDVEAAVDFLRSRPEINRAKIGLIGHSEGGIIAPIVASQIPSKVGFIVLMAGTGIRGDMLLLEQQILVGRAMGMPEEMIAKNQQTNKQIFEIILQEEDPEVMSTLVQEIMEASLKAQEDIIPAGMTREQFVELQLSQISSPWMLTFLRLDPAIYLEKVQCPVMAINGSNDLQVPPSNLQAIEAALRKGGNTQVTLMEFPGLNHLFQACETGSPSNYAAIEQTFAPEVLEAMANWIQQITSP